MIDDVIRYLQTSGVGFRVASYPSPEPQPRVARRFAPGTQLVDSQVILVDGSPALACKRCGLAMNLKALAAETGSVVLESSTADLRDGYRGVSPPLPPLGGVFGIPLFVDERVAQAATLAFQAFSENDYVELSYEDFALLERPRVASFTTSGELPPHAP